MIPVHLQLRNQRLARQALKDLNRLAERSIRAIQLGADPLICFEIGQGYWDAYLQSKAGMPIGLRREAYHTIMQRALPAIEFPSPIEQKPGFFKRLWNKMKGGRP